MSDREPTLGRVAAKGLFVALAIAGGAALLRSHRPALVGQPAPAFGGPIVAGEGAESRDRVSRESLRGQVVVLDFWASWCAPCRASIPILSRIARRHRAGGLVTLGVNIEATQPAQYVARAHRALGAGFPTLHDATWEMQRAFGVHSVPTIVVVDRRGVVRWYERGIPSEDALDAEIREILREPP
jgi:thiol-disulfide isomerase/thioredoxin